MLVCRVQRQPGHLFPYNIKAATNCQSQMMLKTAKCEVEEDFPPCQLYSTESDQPEEPVQLLNPASADPGSDS